MRPSLRIIVLALVLAALSVALLLWPDGAALVALLWGGLGALGLLDLLLTPSGRNLEIGVDLPESGFAGESVALSLSLSTRRARLPKAMALRLAHDEGISAPPLFRLPQAPERHVAARVPLGLRARGTKGLSRLSLAYPSRLGLFEVIQNWPLDLSIRVLPNINPVLNGAVQTQILPLLNGGRLMKMRGDGSEFHQLRDFVPGMDTRSIDWKRSARANMMVARETRAERNHQIMLCLDTGHLMAERLGDLSRLDHAINAALALTWAGTLGGDNVGFYSFSSRPQPIIAPRAGQKAFAHIRAACAELEQDRSESNPTLGLTYLGGKLKRRSLIVVFSEFADPLSAELLVENLGLMRKQHLVLYITLRDPVLARLAHPAGLSMESISRGIAAGRLLAERQAVLDRLRRLGVLCLETAPDRLTPDLIARYVEIKAKELI